jgi:hypothetical protein
VKIESTVRSAESAGTCCAGDAGTVCWAIETDGIAAVVSKNTRTGIRKRVRFIFAPEVAG